MDGIDDLARFHLWFIDAAGLRRPHLLGHSIGGWTAAEMAAMSPGSIDRLVLVAPAGLKPEAGEILDIFFHSPQQLRDLTVHDPKTIPEWDELFGKPPTPAELEIAERNREMTARLTWKPYMFSRRLAPLLREVRTPALIIHGAEDAIVPVDVARQYAEALPNARLEVVPNRGHLMEYEDSAAIGERIARFALAG